MIWFKNARYVQFIYAKLLKEMKLTPHVFRHTTALHLIEAGNDVTIVKEWLGHADIKTTSQYIEVSVARKREALEKLPPPGSGERVVVPEWKAPGIIEFLSSLSGNRKLSALRFGWLKNSRLFAARREPRPPFYIK